jgi:hypothetical protein
MTPSDSHSLCSSAGVPSLRRVAGAPPALVSLPARIMSLDASSSVPGARSSTSRSRRRATRMPHRRLAEASMSSPSAPSAWLVRCEPAQYLRRASTSHHCRPFIALVSHTACAAPTQQQHRHPRASPRAHPVVRRRREVSILCTLVTSFCHVSRFCLTDAN